MIKTSIQMVFDTFIAATEAIDGIYFQIPVAMVGDPQYRERFYCYELYHQMRSRWPRIPQRITGEIDKTGHPWIYRGELNKSKPDFVIHVPGFMGPNLLVIEVKGPKPDRDDIRTDLRKLTGYYRDANYPAAYYLVYGLDMAGANDFVTECHEIAVGDDQIDLGLITFFHHAAPGTPARHVHW